MSRLAPATDDREGSGLRTSTIVLVIMVVLVVLGGLAIWLFTDLFVGEPPLAGRTIVLGLDSRAWSLRWPI